MANFDCPELDVGDDIPHIHCVDMDPDRLTPELNKYSRGSFSLLGFNVRSCRRNFASLLVLLSVLLYKFSMIVLVETWLTEVNDYNFDINGYEQLNLYRNNFGGGIKILYDNCLNVSILENFTFINNIIEILTVKVVGRGFKYIVCAVYRPPNSNCNEFNLMFFNIINMFHKNDKIMIIGDINFNLFNALNLNYIDDFMNQLYMYKFHPIIRKGTRINCNNETIRFTLLDQIWTNFDYGISRISGVITTVITDHFPIFYVFKNNFSHISKNIKFRLFSCVNANKFVELVNGLDLDNLYEINNANESFNYFHNKLIECYNSAFPIKTKKIKFNKINSPWVNLKIKRCIKKKYKLFNLFKRGLITKRQFVLYKKTLCSVIYKARKLYFIRKFNNSSDIKETWGNINKLMNKGKKNEAIKVLDENNVEVDSSNTAEYFNNYFINIPIKLSENLPNFINYEYFSRTSPMLNSCVLLPTSDGEVFDVLKSMSNKCNKIFDIQPSILMQIKEKILPALVFLFNRCLSAGVYPDILKIARVVPIFKGGNPNNVCNYRPISNLTTINKLFEKLIHFRLNSFIECNHLLSKFQFGFRKLSNTTLAVFTLVTDILRSFNRKVYTIAIFIDLKKAFDTVNNEILIHKLSRYGIRGVAGSMLKSYLQDRRQFTDVNGSVSGMKSVAIGVPQGSVLGPLLFNLFIDDITNIKVADKILFADDAVFYVTDASLATCITKLNLCISELSTWFYNNKLTLNTDKTKLMLFTPRHVDNLPVVRFNNKSIEWVNSLKYLGIIIDNNLNFIFQSKEVRNKLSKLHGIFYSLKNFIPRNVLINMYYSLVYSAVTYNIIIWGGIADSNTCNIRIMLNKILRCIFNIGRNENNIPVMHTSDMYKMANMLQYHDIFKFFLLKFIHFLLYDRYDIFEKYFSHLLPRHSYSTRNVKINLPPVRLDIEKQSTLYNCCKVVNELNNCFLQPQSRYKLKQSFKCYCMQNY